jgi:hypothetical protein
MGGEWIFTLVHSSVGQDVEQSPEGVAHVEALDAPRLDCGTKVSSTVSSTARGRPEPSSMTIHLPTSVCLPSSAAQQVARFRPSRTSAASSSASPGLSPKEKVSRSRHPISRPTDTTIARHIVQTALRPPSYSSHLGGADPYRMTLSAKPAVAAARHRREVSARMRVLALEGRTSLF